jgi:hypothetical protein
MDQKRYFVTGITLDRRIRDRHHRRLPKSRVNLVTVETREMQMFKNSLKTSIVIAALLTGAFHGFVSQATAAMGDVCVAGEIVHLTAKQGAVPIPQ